MQAVDIGPQAANARGAAHMLYADALTPRGRHALGSPALPGRAAATPYIALTFSCVDFFNKKDYNMSAMKWRNLI
ncbi:MAG: hypothetical protein ACI4L8_09270 [Candidatus Fimadaptatus sp.]